MQAITIAIGRAGIEYFAANFVAASSLKNLNGMNPPDHDADVESFHFVPSGGGNNWIDGLHIALRNGRMEKDETTGLAYEMKYDGFQQKEAGTPVWNYFDFRFHASKFKEIYRWKETYQRTKGSPYGGHAPPYDCEDTFDYMPITAELLVNPILRFVYSESAGYSILVVQDRPLAKATVSDPAIPKHSIVEQQVQGACFSHHVTEATAKMLADLDFKHAIEAIFPPRFASIPASGNLSDSITYDFALAMGDGENGLKFSDGGITIGVTGPVTWQDENGEKHLYDQPPGEVAPSLPVPVVPIATGPDAPFMNVYVSSYEINALYWAYFKAERLRRIVRPEALPSPAVLNTETYATAIPALEPYDDAPMFAYIDPLEAPALRFQQVYLFDTKGMEALQRDLQDPAIYKKASRLAGHAYDSEAALKAALVKKGLTESDLASCFQTICTDTGQKGLVTASKLSFTLVVQDGDMPFIKFHVTRTDIMTDLKLRAAAFRLTPTSFETLHAEGLSDETLKKLGPMKDITYRSSSLFNAKLEYYGVPESLYEQIRKSAQYPVQSLQFSFVNASNSVSFDDTDVPDLEEEVTQPLNNIWITVGETQYMTAMKEMGQTGAPIPIMDGFHFLFDRARLNIEDGYISIQTQAHYRE